jgi:hypothetical protein
MPIPMAELYHPSSQRMGGTTTGIKKQNNNLKSEKYL